MKSLFERCYQVYGSLSAKFELLSRELKSSPPEYYDGLRMTLLEGVKPVTRVRTPDGTERPMLMLGSNSFLNLNYHPRVLEAERRALERYGAGCGSPPLYAGTSDLHRELEMELAQSDEITLEQIRNKKRSVRAAENLCALLSPLL